MDNRPVGRLVYVAPGPQVEFSPLVLALMEHRVCSTVGPGGHDEEESERLIGALLKVLNALACGAVEQVDNEGGVDDPVTRRQVLKGEEAAK